ncbi:MAG: hypothetical protein RIC80_18265 [Cyclobacteriaceae bacterium]
MKDLFTEEERVLSGYRRKIENEDIYLEDAESFASNYKDLIDQTRVITRISDRLQKKLDMANQKIKSQNHEIGQKNELLENTIIELTRAKVSKKASTILLTLALILFIWEQYLLEPFIESYVIIPYLGIVLKGLIAFSLKFFETGIENYFMKKEQGQILRNRGKSLKTKLAYSGF